MFLTIRKLPVRSSLALPVLVLTLVAAGIPATAESDRANDAWSDRLTRQAEVQDDTRAARAARAWSQRLNELAASGPNEGGAAVRMSDRANIAWSTRLTGLAEHLAAQE